MNLKLLSFMATFLVLTTACSSTSKNPFPNPVPPPPNIILETDTLEAKPGYTGKILGAIVKDSTIGPYGEQQIIEINVPVDPDQIDIDQVRVISPSGETLKQIKNAEIMRNYETDNVGITIFISKEKNMSFKLRLIDKSEDDQL